MPNTETHRNESTPQSGNAAIGDLDMHYLDWGGDGEPLLALHGLASSGHWYRRVAPFLSGRYRVIAPDQRGHGATHPGAIRLRLANPGGGRRAADGSLRAWRGLPCWATRGGGHVASNLAMRFPDRVSRVVMIDGGFQDGGLLPEPTWEAFRQRLAPRLVVGTREEYLDRLADNLSFCWGDDLAEIALTMVHEGSDGQMYDNLRPQNHAQVLETMWNEPPSVVLPRITVPALVIAAGPRADRANSQFSRQREVMVAAAEAALPNGRVHWIQDTIHDIGYHKPEELAAVIHEFLS